MSCFGESQQPWRSVEEALEQNLHGPSKGLRATALRARLDEALIASRCENYRPRQTKESIAATTRDTDTTDIKQRMGGWIAVEGGGYRRDDEGKEYRTDPGQGPQEYNPVCFWCATRQKPGAGMP